MNGIPEGHAQALYRAVLTLRTEEECAAFFDDLCTIRELQDMAQRMQVALLLAEGEKYQQVFEKTGVSTATITRVNRCLQYGSGGYRLAIDRINTAH